MFRKKRKYSPHTMKNIIAAGIVVLFVSLPFYLYSLTVTQNTRQHAAGTPPSLLFGIGTEATVAAATPLAQQAPVKMLTNWYNGSSDLSWMSGLKQSIIPSLYAKGYALHLIVYDPGTEGNVNTKYGTACGRPYSLSSGFLNDMKQLASIFNGNGPLYVTMFTELQTYSCVDNQWVGNEHYYQALKDQYTQAITIFHQNAPHSYVSLGWGGWQVRTDNPQTGGGKSMIPHFADIMNTSDFQSFQSMQNDSNTADITNMSRLLHSYGM